MKKMTLSMLALSSLALSGSAFAHGTKVDVLGDALSAAMENVETNQTADTQARLTGVKGWFVDDGIRVRVYLTNNETIELHCHQHEHDAPFECMPAQ